MALHDDVTHGVPPSRTLLARVRWFTVTAGIESLGDSLSRTLLPIVAVSVLGAGTATVGVLNSLGLLAFLVLGLPLGVLADRWSPPTAMMTMSTLTRGAAVLGVAVAWTVGWLDGGLGLLLLVVLALIIGVADVGYTTGQGLLVPRLVGPENIRSLVGRVQTATQAGGAVGPMALLGLLTLVAAPLAWVGSAFAYLVSALTQRGIGPIAPSVPPPVRRSWSVQAQEGIGWIRAQPTLRRITAANTLTNASVMTANTILPVIALSQLGVSPAVYAAIGATGALAGIAGAIYASAITGKIGLRTTRVAAGAGMTAGIVMVMLAGGLTTVLPGPAELWLAQQSALAGLCGSVALVAGSDLAPRLTPAAHLGAVMGAQRMLVLGVMPISAVAVGALGAILGLAPTLYLWFALALISIIPSLKLADPDRSPPDRKTTG